MTCYGRDAEELAEQVRIFIYLPGTGNPASILKKAGIYIMPNIREPVISYEETGSRWRKRADVEIHLRIDKKLTYTKKQPMLDKPPLVRLITHMDLFCNQPSFP